MPFFPAVIENLILPRCSDPGDIIDMLKVTSSCYVPSLHIQELLKIFFEYKTAVLNGEQEKESINRVRVGNIGPLGVPFVITQACLVMPMGDPRGGIILSRPHTHDGFI